ncbi:CPBP family intramembrane glutamic endopeptidase [Pseudoxanthomonas sp.]|uniref:CPBP family intramembrane glutamic endopeptidase n=1 Tax=Pseudoxanthomonas sp. TaxID=1871049 RepID=UPI00261EB475|nr:CPBP family intramembrane glutamic endopeptidase [Pseudoxanthomonas sp.]WDS36282.1 MAG: CPBP family intramembrane metalloprotease [Pseudoxanthomonas sp.]
MPYLAQLMPGRFAQLPIPFAALVAIQSMQALVLLGLLAWLGLRMGHRVDLGSPVLQAWLIGRARPDWSRLRPGRSALLGGATGLVVLTLSVLLDPLLPPMLNPPVAASAHVSALNGLLASLYGGIAEELQLRLFLMTLLVWAVARVRRVPPTTGTYWIAAMIAALLFGAGHLPAAAHLWGLDASVVTRTLLLNGIAGLAFGWLYWKRGLEMAMLGHFCADLVLHVAVPLFGLGMPQ